MAELILGSASPRRRELLALVRPEIRFRVVSPDVDESVLPGERPADYLERIVRAKARDVAERLQRGGERSSAIVCADTSVMVGQKILGKPQDDAEGRAMLLELSGRVHEVGTAFIVADREGAPLHEELVLTQVRFRALDEREIAAYVASGEGRDKAGGYAMQGGAAPFVSRIDGSPTNVIGLPLCELTVALARLGLR